MLILPWLVPGDPNSFQALKKALPALECVSPCYFSLNAEFELKTAEDPNYDELMSLGLKVYPLVVNEGFKPEVAAELLKTKEAREKTAEILVAKVIKEDYHGLNVDFEGPFGEYREEYSEFIALLADMLHKEGKEISVDVISQTKEPTPSHSWGYPFEYEKLGAVVDYLILMGYDYSSVFSPPGPVAPNQWLKEVKEYTLQKVPADKVILGLPFYGRHWNTAPDGTHSQGRGVTYKQAMSMADEWQTEPKVHESGCLHIDVKQPDGSRDQIFFEDKTTLLEKIKIAQGLAGIAFWRLGQEDDGLWDYL
ncbi:MAG TPA: hypothetical protein GX522_08735, partial [Firmicutes bacterium]|nr:hypothetical protein [Bacillota bacterium]